MHRRTLLVAVVLALAVSAGTTATTLALFHADAPATTAELTAGTVSLVGNRDNGDRVPGPMFYTTPPAGATPRGRPGLYPTGFWAPGDTFHRVFQIENVGTLDTILKTVRASLEGGSRALADKLQVRVTTDAAGANVVAAGTLGQFIDADQAFAGGPIPVNVRAIQNLHFWVTLPRDADNTYQSLPLGAAFSVYAEQSAHNP